MTLHFDAAADADIAEAYAWYESKKEGLGDEFLKSLNDVLNLILDDPHSYSVVEDLACRSVLRRFPYCVYFKIESNKVRIIACFHSSRDPTIWMFRAKKE